MAQFILKDSKGKEQTFDHETIYVRDTNGELVQFTQGEGDIPAVVQPLEVTENGTYTAPDGVDGYSPVTVNVAGSGGGLPAGVYFGFGDYAPPNHYYQQWFMYNGSLYVMARTASTSGNQYNMYKLVDGLWSTVISNGVCSAGLQSPCSWSFFEFNGLIHMLGCDNSYHFVFNGTSFTEKNRLPYSISKRSMFVQNNQLKAYSYYDGKIYVWDESTDTWSSEATIGSKYNYYYAVNLGGDVYLFNEADLYKYENGAKMKIATLSVSATMCIAYKSCLYYFFNRYHTIQNKFWSEWYKYDPATGKETFLGYGPHSDSNNGVIILQNKLYLWFGNPSAKVNIGVMHEVTE